MKTTSHIRDLATSLLLFVLLHLVHFPVVFFLMFPGREILDWFWYPWVFIADYVNELGLPLLSGDFNALYPTWIIGISTCLVILVLNFRVWRNNWFVRRLQAAQLAYFIVFGMLSLVFGDVLWLVPLSIPFFVFFRFVP